MSELTLEDFKGSNIYKSFINTEENSLEKGGEGSRGGKVIGHTQSGKPIYDTANHPRHKDFTNQEHHDVRKLYDEKRWEEGHGENHYYLEHQTQHNKMESKREKELSVPKVIGKTKSGKEIFSNAGNKSHKDFTIQDHKDAIEAHKNRKNEDGFESSHSFENRLVHEKSLKEAKKLENKNKKISEGSKELSKEQEKKREAAKEKRKAKDKESDLTDEEKNLSKEDVEEHIHNHVNSAYYHADEADPDSNPYGEKDYDHQHKSDVHWSKAKKLAKHHKLDFNKFV